MMEIWDIIAASLGEIMGLTILVVAAYLFYKKILKKIWMKNNESEEDTWGKT